MSSFSTMEDEVGGTITRMGRRVSPPADELFPIPAYQGRVVMGFTPYADLQRYLSGDSESPNEKYSVMCELNKLHRKHMSKASDSLGLDFKDRRIKQALINSAILWTHATGEPDFGDYDSQFKEMQSRAREDQGDTVKTLEALHTLMYGEKSKAMASLLSVVRARYTTEHFSLGVHTVEEAIRHDVDERRWTAVQSFIDEYKIADRLHRLGEIDTAQTQVATGDHESADPMAHAPIEPEDFEDEDEAKDEADSEAEE